MTPTGFSIATSGTWSSAVKALKNPTPMSCLPSRLFLSNHAAPLDARCVHGGKASTASQRIFTISSASAWMCHSGWRPLVGSRSHE